MKVSKVNHVRTGSEGVKPGIMYKNPSVNQDSRIRVEDQVKYVNQTAQRLYNLFNAKQVFGPVKELRGFENSITKDFNNVVKNIVKQSEKSIDLGKAMTLLGEVRLDSQGVQNAGYIVERILSARLRNSLKGKIMISGERRNVYDAIKAVIVAISEGKNLSEDDVKTMLTAVCEDYYKTDKITKIVASIEKKDVKVQIYKEGDDKILRLSSWSNEKKRFISDFVDQFAEATPEEQSAMLIGIRRLIILYTRGVEAYNEACDSDIAKWSWMSMKASDDLMFVEGVTEKLTERDQAEKSFTRKSITAQIETMIDDQILTHYMKAKEADIDENDLKWIAYFEDETSKLYSRRRNVVDWKLRLSYLEDYLWDCWVSFAASKFVDIGKAVYHFALPELNSTKTKDNIRFGVPESKYDNGITGFDYEIIRANESLTRGMDTYVSFATNCFANSTIPIEYRLQPVEKKDQDKADVLFYSNEEFSENLIDVSTNKLLRYFGGISRWWESEVVKTDRVKVALAIRECMSLVRNACYHYAPGEGKLSDESREIIAGMLADDMKRVGGMYRRKYYSNNVLMFYPEGNITSLMNKLYEKKAERVAQVPAFNNVFKRKDIAEFLSNYVEKAYLDEFSTNQDAVDKYRSSMFFVLKEIYYYGFLQETDLKNAFMEALKNMKSDAQNPEAYKNFYDRITEITESDPDVSFGEICQFIMTDYNMQNQDKIKKSDEAEERAKENGHKKKYQHFRMLLYKGIEKAFNTYLKNDPRYAFLVKPKYDQEAFSRITEDVFCNGWTAHTFDTLADGGDDNVISWYAVAHFLTPKQLNQLIGTFRNYDQYVNDIVRRAKSVGIDRSDALGRIEYCNTILYSLEFVALFAGNISKVMTDYFADENEYASYVGKYVQIAGKKVVLDETKLKEFCSKKVKSGNNEYQIGIYYDETNPIMNRNIVLAAMYGFDAIIAEGLSRNKVSEENIGKFYGLKSELADVFAAGVCKTKEQQEKLLSFQQLKNKIELVDISIYSDIINDLYSQLIGWAYLRERDLMYFQLGFNYCRLFHGKTVERDSHLRKISGNGISIDDGAVLYQIAAMYTFDMPVYGKDGSYKSSGTSAGGSIRRFVYDYCGEDFGNAVTYNNGLGLFEDIRIHDEYSRLRNDIAHMKYMSKHKDSIVKLYRDIYDGFFKYDRKLEKSVVFILKNTLMDYFVDASVSIGKTEKKLPETSRSLTRASFTISAREMKSDVFTYNHIKVKRQEGKREIIEPLKLPVRSDDFLARLASLLTY